METFTLESGVMIEPTALENTSTTTEPSMRVHGKTTNKMEMGLKPGQMRPSIKGNS